MLRIIREILEFKPQEKGTDIGEALRYLTNAIKKRCTAFLLSDMLDTDEDGAPRYEDAIKIAAGRHDLSVINIYDPREREIPDVGLVRIRDAESGQGMWIDTSSARVRSSFAKWNRNLYGETITLLRKYKVDNVNISTNQDYVKELISFFKNRA